MPGPIDNPAARLLALLERAIQPDTQSLSAGAAWAKVLGLEDDNLSDLTLFLREALGLPDQVEQAIRALPKEPHETFLEWKNNVVQVLTSSLTNMSNSWTNVRNPLDEKTLYSLRMCGEKLSLANPEPVLPEDELEAIRAELLELRKRIEEGSLPPELKNFLSAQLAEALYALFLYKIHGESAIREGLQKIAGRAVLNPELTRNSRETEVDPIFQTKSGPG